MCYLCSILALIILECFTIFLRSFLFLPGLKSGQTNKHTHTNKQTHRLGRISPLKISDSKRPKTCTSWESLFYTLAGLKLVVVYKTIHLVFWGPRTSSELSYIPILIENNHHFLLLHRLRWTTTYSNQDYNFLGTSYFILRIPT